MGGMIERIRELTIRVRVRVRAVRVRGKNLGKRKIRPPFSWC